MGSEMKLTIVHDGDRGYEVTVPDLTEEKCERCGGRGSLRFIDVESYSQTANKWVFDCTLCGNEFYFWEEL
jgi:hypothetical protein